MKTATKHSEAIVEGPMGFKMPESLARSIEDVSRDLPKDFTFRRLAKTAADFQLEPGSRTDVSTVTTDSVDHQKEVVLPTGIDLSVFRKNPVVPYCHDYSALPVGKCLWIKPSAGGNGLAALTKYASRPEGWTGDWLPDALLSLMREGMCTGKSIGFVPTHMRAPTSAETALRPDWKVADVIIDKATLLEYSPCGLPCNPDALAEAVSKSFNPADAAERVIAAAKALAGGNPEKAAEIVVEAAAVAVKEVESIAPEFVAAFVSPETLAAYQRRLLAQLPARVEAAARAKFADALDRLRGRV